MTSSSESAYATEKYRLSLPYVLLSVSPSLAALHATRFQNLHPDTADILDPTHCKGCGTYLFDGQSSTLLMRRKRKRKQAKTPSLSRRVYRRTCRACGFTDDVPIVSTYTTSPSLPATVPLVEKDTESPGAEISRLRSHPPSQGSPPTTSEPMLAPTSTPVSAPAPGPSVPPSTTQSVQPKSKKNDSRKTTLQDMLARERRREQARKAQKNHVNQGGLAAFLKDL